MASFEAAAWTALPTKYSTIKLRYKDKKPHPRASNIDIQTTDMRWLLDGPYGFRCALLDERIPESFPKRPYIEAEILNRGLAHRLEAQRRKRCTDY